MPVAGRTTADELLDALAAKRVTAVFVEEPADAVAIVHAARERASPIPEDLSILGLGAPTRPVHVDIDFTGFRIPRREMGRRAVELLMEVLEGGGETRRSCCPASWSTAPRSQRSEADQNDRREPHVVEMIG